MKNVFELTAHDSKANYLISKNFYSNRKSAHESFNELKEYIIKKFGLNPSNVEKFTFMDGGDHQTIIISDRFNITLVKWNVSNIKGVFE